MSKNFSSTLTKTYYEILDVERNATPKEIRRAYLRLSLKHHPDKNPNNVEESKLKFIEIGQAHETLIDPQKRAAYDRELLHGSRHSGRSSFNNEYNDRSDTNNFNFATYDNSQAYETYQGYFDATVAGMTEEELANTVGKVAAVAGLVGGIIGGRYLANKASRSGSNSNSLIGGMMETAGSMVGSAVASEIATSSIKALHRQVKFAK